MLCVCVCVCCYAGLPMVETRYPWQVVIGAKSEDRNEIEVKRRASGDTTFMSLEEFVAEAQAC